RSPGTRRGRAAAWPEREAGRGSGWSRATGRWRGRRRRGTRRHRAAWSWNDSFLDTRRLLRDVDLHLHGQTAGEGEDQREDGGTADQGHAGEDRDERRQDEGGKREGEQVDDEGCGEVGDLQLPELRVVVEACRDAHEHVADAEAGYREHDRAEDGRRPRHDDLVERLREVAHVDG